MDKYCPHALKVEQVNQTTREFNENGSETVSIHKLVEVQHMTKCKKKQCGSWFMGRCRRR